MTHRVRRGDTLSHIARRHRVSTALLRRVNRLSRNGRLRIGQTIRVPVPNRAT